MQTNYSVIISRLLYIIILKKILCCYYSWIKHWTVKFVKRNLRFNFVFENIGVRLDAGLPINSNVFS